MALGISRLPLSLFRRAIYPLYVFLMYIHLIIHRLPLHTKDLYNGIELRARSASNWADRTALTRKQNVVHVGASSENFKIRKWESTSMVLRATDLENN